MQVDVFLMIPDSEKLAEAFDAYVPKDTLFMFLVLERQPDGTGRMTTISSLPGQDKQILFLEEALERARSK